MPFFKKKKQEHKPTLFHQVYININKILVFVLPSSLRYLRTAGIFSRSNKEKNIRKPMRETCHFKNQMPNSCQSVEIQKLGNETCRVPRSCLCPAKARSYRASE